MPLGVARWDLTSGCALKPCQLVFISSYPLCSYRPNLSAPSFCRSLLLQSRGRFPAGFQSFWSSVTFVEEHGVSQPQGCACRCCWVIHTGRAVPWRKPTNPPLCLNWESSCLTCASGCLKQGSIWQGRVGPNGHSWGRFSSSMV